MVEMVGSSVLVCKPILVDSFSQKRSSHVCNCLVRLSPMFYLHFN